MALTRLLDKINLRKDNVFTAFPLLTDEISKAAKAAARPPRSFPLHFSQLRDGTAIVDGDTKKQAKREVFVFEYYLIQLSEINPTNDEDQKIQAALATIRSLLPGLYRIAGIRKYEPNLSMQTLKEKHAEHSNSNLLQAAEYNNEELLDAALAAGANVNFFINKCALQYAQKNKNTAMIAKLIKAGANPNGVNHSNLTPLIAAVEENDLPMVKTLIEQGADVNFYLARFDHRDENAIHIACMGYVSFELFEYLVSVPGIDLNKTLHPLGGESVLYKALIYNTPNGDIRKVLLLLQSGLIIKNDYDFCTAIERGIKAVRLMLGAGYQCTKKVLEKAIEEENADIIDLLAKQTHADIAGIKDSLIKYNKYTDLMVAVTIGDINEVKRILALSKTDINIDHDESDGVLASRLSNKTALMIAATLGRVEIARLLLAAGADVNHANKYGSTAMMSAARKGHIEMVELLLSYQADVNKQTTAGYPSGETALHMAMTNQHKDVVKRLLKVSNIDLSIKPEDGMSAMKRLVGREELPKQSDIHFNKVKPEDTYQEINTEFNRLYPYPSILFKENAKDFYHAATGFIDEQHKEVYNKNYNTSLVLTILCCIPIVTIPFSILIFDGIFGLLSKNDPIQKKKITGLQNDPVGLETKINNRQNVILKKNSLFNEHHELRKIREGDFIYGTKHQFDHLSLQIKRTK